MDKKIILAFTGRMGSGKDTASDFFKKHYNAVAFKFSTPLRDILDRVHAEQNRENMQWLGAALRDHLGNDILSKTIALDVVASSSMLIVVDGSRYPEDVEHLKKLPGFVLVAIDTPPEIRFERITKRGENVDDATKTWEDFQKQDQAPTEVIIPELMRQASVTIDNSGSKEEFFAQLETLYKKVTNES